MGSSEGLLGLGPGPNGHSHLLKVRAGGGEARAGQPWLWEATDLAPLAVCLQTPLGGQKRSFSHLLPSPEPSPEGSYVGQHSQGLGGHYADSYLKRKRIF